MTTASLRGVGRYLRLFAERDTHGPADRQLLDRFTRHRDEAAFAELVRRHGPMVLGVCRRVLRHEQDAEDAFQAAFLVLAKKAGSVRQSEAVGGWLYQVARRLALRARAAGARRRGRLTPLGDEPLADGGPPGDGLPAPVDEELQRLPEPYRTAVVLCYLEGRTQADAARLLATTAGAVNSRLKRARELLRQRLARRGLALSGAALIAGAARAALPPALARLTARVALDFTTNRAAPGASALAAALAKGALHGMFTPKLKLISALALALVAALVAAGALSGPAPALGDDQPTPAARDASPQPGPAAGECFAGTADVKDKPRRSCVILWMGGGPSQIDTFDPKPGHVNGGPFKAIDTAVKGVQISEHLPKLAKLADRLAIIRSLAHDDGDHTRATHLMRTGYPHDGLTDFPALGSVLAKELGGDAAEVPGYVGIGLPDRPGDRGYGPGFLGPQYGPLAVGRVGKDQTFELPAAAAFEALDKKRAGAMRKAVTKAFDLTEEKAAVRDAYGRGAFGQGCLLARRLVEAGVPVVEVTLPGWDTHANNFAAVQRLSGELDPAWSALLKDLEERKRLDSTLVVWMGEFGRTPKINAGDGRDHWPKAFSVVLAGAGIKGGQVIGKTSDDGTTVQEQLVTPYDLLATVYQALGIDPAKENRVAGTNKTVPLVGKGAKPVKEALR